MNKTTILVAGSFGIIIGLGILGVRRYLIKKSKEYDDYYADFHRHFDRKIREESNDGVEFLAVR
ncbi:hypothetical protein [Kaistella carnis]|uniref:hypothetical protein n=1 Tax=Kaistella carnis TaxID=1241979 RepID=UPI002897F3EB|nr:hypothetical protein [Kaistella carnis]